MARITELRETELRAIRKTQMLSMVGKLLGICNYHIVEQLWLFDMVRLRLS
jgi:hypothetical protein